jgi:hypothetical protein
LRKGVQNPRWLREESEKNWWPGGVGCGYPSIDFIATLPTANLDLLTTEIRQIGQLMTAVL